MNKYLKVGLILLAILFILIILVLVIIFVTGNKKTVSIAPVVVANQDPSAQKPGDYAPVMMCKKDLSGSSSDSDCGSCDSSSSGSGCGSCDSSSSSGCDSGTECFSLEGCNRKALYGSKDACDGPPISEQDYFSNFDKCIIKLCDPPNQIRDITQSGYNIIYLIKLNNSQVMVRTKKGTYAVTSSMSLDRILAFDGDVYAINNGKLYIRDPESVNKRIWYWSSVSGVPTGITWITATLDNCNMWIQTSDGKGHLLDRKLSTISTVDIPTTTIRIYGRSKKVSADIDTLTNYLTVNSNDKRFGNVGNAIYNWQNSVILIRPPQKAVVSGIRLINWKPYFILQ
jgi:hypothetical protein